MNQKKLLIYLILILSITSNTTVMASWRETSSTRPKEAVKFQKITQAEVDQYTIDELEGLFNHKTEIDFVVRDMTDSVNTLWIITSAINIIAM